MYHCAIEYVIAIAKLNKSGFLRISKARMIARWKRPDMPWIKINSDEACKDGGNNVVVKGVLRDWTGN